MLSPILRTTDYSQRALPRPQLQAAISYLLLDVRFSMSITRAQFTEAIGSGWRPLEKLGEHWAERIVVLISSQSLCLESKSNYAVYIHSLIVDEHCWRSLPSSPLMFDRFGDYHLIFSLIGRNKPKKVVWGYTLCAILNILKNASLCSNFMGSMGCGRERIMLLSWRGGLSIFADYLRDRE